MVYLNAMTTANLPGESEHGVVQNVFDEFLKRLDGDESVDPSAVDRLRKVLQGDQDLSVENLRGALFNDRPLP